MQNQNIRKTNIHIDYYCFPTETGDTSVFTNLEQYTNFQKRGHYERTLKEVMQAKKLGKLLLFDMRNNGFVNESGETIDITGKVIFPRSTIQQEDLLMENIEKAQGKSITSRKDCEILENWFKKVRTKRDYKLTTMREIESNLDYYEKQFGKSFFLKTVQKKFSGICTIVSLPIAENVPETKFLIDSHFHSLNIIIQKSGTPILVYKKVEILEDKFGKREWRAFVVNDQLISVSRSSDEVVTVEEYVFKNSKEKIEEFKGLVPSSYVVDFFEYKEDDNTIFDVVEFNPIIASGTFAANDLIF